MRIWTPFVCFLWAIVSCQHNNPTSEQIYPDQLGSIAHDASKDSPDFRLCHEADLVHSRTSLSYKGGRAKIVELTKEQFANSDRIDFDGCVVVHFLVNCQGHPGRVRFEAMDEAFAPKNAPEALVNLLRDTVLSLNNWVISKPANEGKDHSKYLNFKFVNGEVVAITH